eukprot:5560222-Alexandrium_andersonii.AAC.1
MEGRERRGLGPSQQPRGCGPTWTRTLEQASPPSSLRGLQPRRRFAGPPHGDPTAAPSGPNPKRQTFCDRGQPEVWRPA